MQFSYPPRRFTTTICFLLFTLIAFQSGTPTSHAQGNAVVLSGRVTAQADGAPIAGLTIALFEANGPAGFDVAVTDNSGRYTVTTAINNQLPNLIPGSYKVYFKSNDTHISEYYNDTTDWGSAVAFQLTTDVPTTGIDAALVEGGQIRGKVFNAQDGKALERTVLSLYNEDGTHAAVGGFVIPDSNGNYVVAGIPPGRYKIGATMLDTDNPYVGKFYPNKLRLSEAEAIELSAGESITNVDFSLELGGLIKLEITSSMATTYSWASIVPFVEVYDAAGQLMQTRYQLYDNYPYPYTLANLPPGSYRLRITDQTGWHVPTYYEHQQTLATATPLELTANQVISDIHVELAFLPRVNSLATSSALPNTIFLTRHYNQIPVYTTDGGVHWRETPTTPWYHADSLTTPLVSLAPRDDANSPIRMLVADANLTKLYRSGQNGLNWAEQSFPLDDCIPAGTSAPISSPLVPTRLYVRVTCWINAWDPIYVWRVFRSNDSGVTWQELPSLAAIQIIPSPVVADRLYIYGQPEAMQYGWWQSDNTGDSWSARDFPVQQLTLDGEDSSKLYGLAEEDIGKRSEDGGEHWVDWAQQPCQFALLPSIYAVNTQLMAHPTQSEVLLLRCHDGLYRSVNGGDHWTQLSTTPGHVSHLLAPDYGVPGRILWAKDDGLWASIDAGSSWQAIMPNYEVNAQGYDFPLFLPSVSTAN